LSPAMNDPRFYKGWTYIAYNPSAVPGETGVDSGVPDGRNENSRLVRSWLRGSIQIRSPVANMASR